MEEAFLVLSTLESAAKRMLLSLGWAGPVSPIPLLLGPTDPAAHISPHRSRWSLKCSNVRLEKQEMLLRSA